MSTVGSASRVDGIDLQAMVNPAAFAHAQPNVTTPPANPESDASISSVGKLRSAASAVLDAASRLGKAQTWSATTATSDNPQVVQAVSNKAATGDYSVSVDALATAQATASATFSSLSTVIGLGTLNIELGSWNTSMSTFATNPNWPKASVTLGPKDTSLERIRDKINAAGVGVIAMVVSDATGSRLVLRSTSTGANNGFKATAEPDDKADAKANAQAAQTLAAMGFDPSKVDGGNATQVQPAQDAKIKIDGRQVQSGQNLIDDKASGLSLHLNGTSDEDVQIHVRPDTASMAGQIHAFASAYNDMSNQLATADPESADSSIETANDIQQRVRTALQPDANPTSLSSQLKDIGIQMNDRGQLDIDDAKLNAALAQGPQQIEPLFAKDAGADHPSSGLATRLQDVTLQDDTGVNAHAATVVSQPHASESPANAAGALFRQKLLEQYVPSSEMHDEEMAIPANAG
ncbi:MAG: flagellar filament capping protein FliD [Aquabacterium sp.]